jgi:hypothetical protein
MRGGKHKQTIALEKLFGGFQIAHRAEEIHAG